MAEETTEMSIEETQEPQETPEPVQVTVGTEIGQIMWFDQRKGYGFTRIVNPESELFDKQVFTHFSSIMCENRYKKVYPGEYVSLDIVPDEKDANKYNAGNVRGVHGSDLLVDNSEYIYRVIRKNRDTNE